MDVALVPLACEVRGAKGTFGRFEAWQTVALTAMDVAVNLVPWRAR